MAGERKRIPYDFRGFVEGFWMFLAGEQKQIPTVFDDFWKDVEGFEAEIFDFRAVF